MNPVGKIWTVVDRHLYDLGSESGPVLVPIDVLKIEPERLILVRSWVTHYENCIFLKDLNEAGCSWTPEGAQALWRLKKEREVNELLAKAQKLAAQVNRDGLLPTLDESGEPIAA